MREVQNERSIDKSEGGTRQKKYDRKDDVKRSVGHAWK